MSPERQWWLRVPAVFLSPSAVFAALREDAQDDVEARQEPVLMLVFVAGIAAALASPTARTLYDDVEYDGLLVAVWAFIAGGLTAVAGYFIIGGALYLGARGLGSLGSYKRARHLLGFAVAPLALSLLLLWPVELAVFGGDRFARDGSDDGTAGSVFTALEVGFGVWAAGLLLVGVRAVHGWSWWRSLGALGLVALFLAAFAYLPSVLG
ncbi:MAG TPA: Yip1 family protein [Gaiellaceae bacterium]|nr:Yip1 family protein [Gaiellaceae bacterium]